MPLTPKDVQCRCGHTSTLQSPKLLCIKCGKYVFYDATEKRRHMTNTIYVLTMLALAAGFVTYMFIEMIASPLLKF